MQKKPEKSLNSGGQCTENQEEKGLINMASFGSSFLNETTDNFNSHNIKGISSPNQSKVIEGEAAPFAPQERNLTTTAPMVRNIKEFKDIVINNDAVRNFVNIPNLQSISFINCQIYLSSLYLLMVSLIENGADRYESLISLDLTNISFLDNIEKQYLLSHVLSKFKNLQYLKIISPFFGEKIMENDYSTLFFDSFISSIKNFPNLKSINLSGAPIGDVGLKKLFEIIKKYNLKIKEIFLDNCALSSVSYDPILELITFSKSNLPNINKLSLVNNNFGYSDLRKLFFKSLPADENDDNFDYFSGEMGIQEEGDDNSSILRLEFHENFYVDIDNYYIL